MERYYQDDPYTDPARMRAKLADAEWNRRAKERETNEAKGRAMTIECRNRSLIRAWVATIDGATGENLTTPVVGLSVRAGREDEWRETLFDAAHAEALILALQAACAEIHARSVGP